jgi:hypothetical protein
MLTHQSSIAPASTAPRCSQRVPAALALDAQDNLLRALAVTQSEHTSRFRRLEDGHRRLEQAVTRVETGIQAILGLLREDH